MMNMTSKPSNKALENISTHFDRKTKPPNNNSCMIFFWMIHSYHLGVLKIYVGLEKDWTNLSLEIFCTY